MMEARRISNMKDARDLIDELTSRRPVPLTWVQREAAAEAMVEYLGQWGAIWDATRDSMATARILKSIDRATDRGRP